MRKLLILPLILTSLYASGQITLNGKAVDNETGEPLPFASVSLQGKPLSTITNLEGEFDFHMPSEYRNDILVISMLGYNNYEAPVWSILSTSPLLIRMEKKSTILDELVITDTLSASEILNLAVSRIEQNYPMDPFIMDGFYRDVKKVAGTSISLLEAAVRIYDENYSKPRNQYKLRENVQLVEVRRSIGYESKFTSYFDQDNLLEDLLLNNPVRYYQLPTEDELKREKNTFYDRHEVFVISHEKNYNLKIFIDAETYGILFIRFENRTNYKEQKRKGLQSRFVYLKKEIAFKSFQGKLYPNYFSIVSRINWYDIKTNDLKFETELVQQLLVNNVEPNTTKRIPPSKKMKDYGLQFQHLSYNQRFWDNYNVIKQTPLDRKIVEDLEKLTPLEDQFKEN